MATTLLNPILVSDWLKYESPNYHSRDTAILAAGSGIVVSGTVLAKLTATGKYVPVAAAGSDGSQTAVACLIEGADGRTTVDATGTDQRVVILSRHADVSHAGLTYGPTITDATKRAAAQGQLAAVGIVTREGACPVPEILDIFNDQAFSAVTLTDTVNLVPNTYGLVGQMGLFEDEPVATTSVALDIANGVLGLLPMRPRGAPASVGTRERQKLKSFVIPHIPHDDSVLALDVQNMLARAPQIGLETVIGAVNRKLITMRRKHAITLENIRVSALKGRILDYDGSVVIDLFQEFGVTEKVFDFALGTAGTDVGAKLREVSGYMEDNLLGDTMTGVMGLASPAWFARYIGHASVKEAFRYYAATAPNADPNRADLRLGFTFQGVTIREYRGSATFLNADGSTSTVQRFIPDGDVRFFPLGTTETFKNYWAPPDFVDEVNTAPGLDAQVFVAPLERMKFGKGMEVHTESNPLPLCKRPNLLARGFSSN